MPEKSEFQIAKDFVHGLVTHPITTLSGKLQPPSAPAKPAYTSESATQHLSPPPASDGGLAGKIVPKAVETQQTHPASQMGLADSMS